MRIRPLIIRLYGKVSCWHVVIDSEYSRVAVRSNPRIAAKGEYLRAALSEADAGEAVMARRNLKLDTHNRVILGNPRSRLRCPWKRARLHSDRDGIDAIGIISHHAP